MYVNEVQLDLDEESHWFFLPDLSTNQIHPGCILTETFSCAVGLMRRGKARVYKYPHFGKVW